MGEHIHILEEPGEDQGADRALQPTSTHGPQNAFSLYPAD